MYNYPRVGPAVSVKLQTSGPCIPVFVDTFGDEFHDPINNPNNHFETIGTLALESTGSAEPEIDVVHDLP